MGDIVLRVALALAILPAIGGVAVAAAAAPPPDALLQSIGPRDSVLVLSPHPDDESLCCGGLIHESLRRGARVAIAWITDGDGFRWDTMVVEHRLLPRHRAFSEMGRRRANEARAAAARLGVPVEAQYFLGYPDRGILSLVMDHYFRDQPWRSRYTGASAVELADALAPGAVYDGADLERDVGAVLERVRPTLVLAPTPRDTHPDHRAVGVLAHRLMQARGESGRVRYWIVHGGRGWPTPRGYSPALPQTVAPRGRDMDWRAFALNAAALDAKRGAVDAHASQAEVMHAVMLSHVRATELYSAQPVAASAPACLQAGPC